MLARLDDAAFSRDRRARRPRGCASRRRSSRRSMSEAIRPSRGAARVAGALVLAARRSRAGARALPTRRDATVRRRRARVRARRSSRVASGASSASPTRAAARRRRVGEPRHRRVGGRRTPRRRLRAWQHALRLDPLDDESRERLAVLQPLGPRSAAYVAPLAGRRRRVGGARARGSAAWLVLALPAGAHARAPRARSPAGRSRSRSSCARRRCSRSSRASRRATSPCSCTAERCSRRPRSESPLARRRGRRRGRAARRARGRRGCTSPLDAARAGWVPASAAHADRAGAAGAIDRVGARPVTFADGAHRSAPTGRGRPDRRRRGGRAARVGRQGARRERARRGRDGDRRRGRGGRTRSSIRVSDDGSGMERDDARARARAPRHVEDPHRRRISSACASFGFRGEALPGDLLGESQLVIETAPADGAGTAIRAAGGAVQRGARRRASPRHHDRRVARLFYNAPARQKFLRGARSEWRGVIDDDDDDRAHAARRALHASRTTASRRSRCPPRTRCAIASPRCGARPSPTAWSTSRTCAARSTSAGSPSARATSARRAVAPSSP